MTPRTSHESEKENRALAKSVGAANRGWMSEKSLPQADQVKCFYLTSPFIEPAQLLRPQPKRALYAWITEGGKYHNANHYVYFEGHRKIYRLNLRPVKRIVGKGYSQAQQRSAV